MGNMDFIRIPQEKKNVTKQLLEEMQQALPLYAYPTTALIKAVKDLKLRSNVKLEICNVHDMGDAGGISCGIKIKDQVAVVSLTHLHFRDEHPLKDKINKYITDRKNWLKLQNSIY